MEFKETELRRSLRRIVDHNFDENHINICKKQGWYDYRPSSRIIMSTVKERFELQDLVKVFNISLPFSGEKYAGSTLAIYIMTFNLNHREAREILDGLAEEQGYSPETVQRVCGVFNLQAS